MSFSDFQPFCFTLKSRVDSILKCFNPRLLFQARVICPYEILKFEAKRYSFGGKLDENLSFSDFQPLFYPKKSRVNSILKFFNPRLLFLARVICLCKILQFEVKRYIFGGKFDVKLSFSDFRPFFLP